MFKRTLFTMTALSSLILISPALQDMAAAGQFNKPMIRMNSPSVKMRIDTRRLVSRKDATKAALPAVQAAASRSSKAKAGPQPEPPTRPKQTKVTNVAKSDSVPLPRSRPDNEFEEGGNGSDNEAFAHVLDIVAMLPVHPPVSSQPEQEPYDEFKEDDDIGGDIDTDGALPPELPVPPAFFDLFGITGNPNDLTDVANLKELRAIPGFFGEVGSDPFEDPPSRLRSPRFGDSMDGQPKAGGDVPNPGGMASNGTGQGRRSNGRAWTWVETTKDAEAGVTSRTYERPSEGGGTDRFTIIIDSTGKIIAQENGSTGEVTVITVEPADENGESEVTVETGQSGESLASESAGTTNGGSVPTEMDRDGDGEPDAVANPEGPQHASQPAPDGNSTAGGTDGCGWIPLLGCTGTGPKIWETTGQPDRSGDGSETGRSAGPSIGPEAVTNGGDGSFTAGGNTGGGGFKLDPCATVSGCGDGQGGPGGPTASMEGVRADLN